MAYDQWTDLAPISNDYTICDASTNGTIIAVTGSYWNGSKWIGKRNLGLYNIADDTWTYSSPSPDVLTSNEGGHCICTEEKVYTFSYALWAPVQIYDIPTDTWVLGPQSTNWMYGESVLYENIVYNIGEEAIVRYDIDTDTFLETVELPGVKKAHSTAQEIDGKIYIAGNLYGSEGPNYDDIMIYDIASEEISFGSTFLPARYNLASAAVGTDLYLIGGELAYKAGFEDPLKDVVIYNTVTQEFRGGPPLPTRQYLHSAVSVGNRIYVSTCTHENLPTHLYVLDVESGPGPADKKLRVLMEAGEKAQLSMSHNLADNAGYTWSSDDASIAQVDTMGLVQAVAPGVTDIHGADNSSAYEDAVPVKVVEATRKLALHLNTPQRQPCFFSESGPVMWSSDDTSVATVNSEGVVQGEGFGLTKVRASQGGDNGQLSVRVNS